MSHLSVVLAFFLCISTASALKCYRCESSKSWAECDAAERNIITCSSGQSQCAKVLKQDKTSTYARGCLTAKECHDGPKTSKYAGKLKRGV
ncbi:hypothetical protein OS493_003354 [Desmophyllum pertusum]|uniref:Uncharacterized protein n=1 Tax=Desmophyllum pertusum TaxID=174260 RepID=A0A9X0A590_9CNID|nr:hypothetical protein OS493_003354 [Desmophyllum pertusum]